MTKIICALSRQRESGGKRLSLRHERTRMISKMKGKSPVCGLDGVSVEANCPRATVFVSRVSATHRNVAVQSRNNRRHNDLYENNINSGTTSHTNKRQHH